MDNVLLICSEYCIFCFYE